MQIFIIRSGNNTHSYKHSFNMFIMIINRKMIAEGKWARSLILWRSQSATSYVTATFHPTIGQCAHQSHSINATPKLGMIPQGTREIIGSHIAQNQNIHNQSNSPLGFTDCPTKPIRNWVLHATKETNQQHMDSLDLPSQYALASNPQSTHLIKHSHTKLLDMSKTFLVAKT